MQRIIAAGDEFWKQVVTKTPPELDDTDDTYKLLGEMNPAQVVGKVIPFSEDAHQWAAELEVLKDASKDNEDRTTHLKNLLRAELGDAEMGVFGDGSGYTYKQQFRKESVSKASTSRPLKAFDAKP